MNKQYVEVEDIEVGDWVSYIVGPHNEYYEAGLYFGSVAYKLWTELGSPNIVLECGTILTDLDYITELRRDTKNLDRSKK